jgi:hypothetical protein
VSISGVMEGEDKRVRRGSVMLYGLTTDSFLFLFCHGCRQLDILSVKTQDYENLLREIGSLVDSRTSERIKCTLDKVRACGDFP